MAKKNNKYTPKTRSEVRKAATVNLPEGVDPREATLRGIFDDAREYANWWYDERAVQDKYKSQLPPEQLQAMKDRLASATFDTSKYGDKIRKSPHAFRAGATDAEINRELMRPTLGGIAAPEDNIFWVKRPTDGNVSHEGIGHIAGDQNYNILKAVPYIGTGDNLAGEEYNRYVTQPNERNAQLWDFRYENRNLKDDSGNYFIDPGRQLTPDDIETMRSKGARFPGQWKNNTNEDIVKLHNAVADIGGVDNPFDVNMAAYGGRLYGIGGQLLNSAKGLVSGSQNGLLGGIASGVSNAISGGMSTGVGGAMQTIGGIASNIPGIGGVIGAGVNVLGGLVNRAFGSQINEQFVADTKENINNQLGAKIDDSSFDSVLEQQATNRGMDGLVKSQVGKDGWFSNKAEEMTKDLNRKIANANNALRMNFANAVNNVTENQNLDTLANYSAYGGGIHIKKANRGKFTEYCGGKVTSECIARGKRSSSPTIRKRATFAANARKWKHEDGGPLNPYSAESLVDAIYSTSKGEQFLGKPSHNYDFTISEEEANRLGYYPDERGHRDDRVKKPAHPTHPSRGKWNSFEEFELTDKGMENPNYTLFGLNDGGQDPQATMTYKGGIVLPEITVTPKKSYIMNPYDNIKIFDKGGSLINKNSSSRKFNNSYKEGEIYDVTEEEVKILKELGYEFEYV